MHLNCIKLIVSGPSSAQWRSHRAVDLIAPSHVRLAPQGAVEEEVHNLTHVGSSDIGTLLIGDQNAYLLLQIYSYMDRDQDSGPASAPINIKLLILDGSVGIRHLKSDDLSFTVRTTYSRLTTTNYRSWSLAAWINQKNGSPRRTSNRVTKLIERRWHLGERHA